MKELVREDHVKQTPHDADANALLDLLSKRSDGADHCPLWKKSLGLLDNMRRDGIDADVISYSAAIDACGSGGHWEEAVDLIRIIPRGHPRLRPNKIAYTAAVTACGRLGAWEETKRLFADMKNAGVQPDRITYNVLLLAMKNGHRKTTIHLK